MSRWFRHYAGMVRDDKLVRAALTANQPVERIVWIYGAILESAAEINNGGRFEIDCAEIAHFLHCDETDCNVSVTALETVGRVSRNVVVNWNKRQFISDSSTERVHRHRSKKKQQLVRNKRNVSETLRNAPETETETEKKDIAPSARMKTDYSESFIEFYFAYPKRKSKKEAEKAYKSARKDVSHETIMEGLKRAIASDLRFRDPQFTPYPASWLRAGGYEDQANVVPLKLEAWS